MNKEKNLSSLALYPDYGITLASSLEKEFIFRRLKTINKLNSDVSNANYLIHKVFCLYRKKNWLHTASTKTKSEVRGGGKKPWPQKGRGRARAGSIRSPLWRGGGVSFGPKPKKLSIKVNHREYDKAIRSLLYVKQNQVVPVTLSKNNTNVSKTKFTYDNLNNICQTLKTENLNKESKLLVVSEFGFKLLKQSTYLNSIKNIENVCLKRVSDLRFDHIVKSDSILITPCAIHELTNKDLLWKK
uniref:Large ribosomal subunit protein uL4c n=1 Tax=Eustigmatophyceae sp. Mont 10/10-1w TaxID=2506145 RepID=A0A451FMM8_9STRA|nr:ribosomal protein L4 [Eustigmatophyceae sp. Mont 10/10-1w]QAA11665.1 ribosomal protein L4 [Eustigmatophyceae sp. Mont 10/10-1w]